MYGRGNKTEREEESVQNSGEEVVERINARGSKFTEEEVRKALVRLHEECEINVETVYRV